MTLKKTLKYIRFFLIFSLINCLIVSVISAQDDPPPAKIKAAVLPLAMNQPLDIGGGVTLASMIGKSLTDSGLYELIESEALLLRISSQLSLDTSCREVECLEEIIELLRLDRIISGELTIFEVEGVVPLYQLKIISVDSSGNKIEYNGETAGLEEEFLEFLYDIIDELLIIPFKPKPKIILTEGSLTIDSHPQNAAIFLDDEMIGNTPLKLDKVKANEHNIKLSLAGYEEWSNKFKLAGGEDKVIIAELIDELGILNLDTKPSGGKVVLNGELMGQTPLKLEIPAGEYNLEISRSSYDNHHQKIKVISSATADLEITLLYGISDAEEKELLKLRKFNEEREGNISKKRQRRLKRLEKMKKRQEIRQGKMENAEVLSTEEITLKLNELKEKHQKACIDKKMVFIQTNEIIESDLTLKDEAWDEKKLFQGFCIDPWEVKVSEFKSFFPSFIASGYSFEEDHPATRITFEQAKSYCEHNGKRLCGREEWTRACKGENDNKYFYGNEYDAKRCRTGLRLADGPVASGSLKDCTNENGIFDMSGNVWEWTDDKYYPDTRVVRGGSWVDKATACDYLGAVDPALQDDTFGFRCCSDYKLE